jgi:hypothetical protein
MNFDTSKVECSRDLGPLFTENTVHMIGQDCAYSAPINDRESFWGFGDTFVGHYDDTGRRIVSRMPSNSGLLCRTRDASNGIRDFTYFTNPDGQLRQLILFEGQESPERHRIWGMDGRLVNGAFYWFYVRVRLLKNAAWPYKFSVDGSGLARANTADFSFRRISQDGSLMLWDEKKPCYGVALFVDEAEGMVYVYGTQRHGKRQCCYLARVPVADIEQVDRYEYLISDQPEWNKTGQKAIGIIEGMPTEMSVSFNAHLGQFLAVHSWQNDGYIVGRTAPNLWGPWSEPFLLWTSRTALRNPIVYNGPVVYAGKEHPELARENGKIIYLTCVEFEEYFPRLIEVTLK